MPVTTNTRKLAALLGASGAGIATDGTLTSTSIGEVIVAADLADDSVGTDENVNDAVTADKLANSINTDIATGVAALLNAGGTMTGNIVMADDTSIGIADDAERIEFDGAGDISVLGANFGIGTSSPSFYSASYEGLHVYHNDNPVIIKASDKLISDSIGNSIWGKSNHRILGVGRFKSQKNFETLIKAFSLLPKNLKAKLIILGEGDERSKLENLINKLNIQSSVLLPGF